MKYLEARCAYTLGMVTPEMSPPTRPVAEKMEVEKKVV
jgi:hypothetical protein